MPRLSGYWQQLLGIVGTSQGEGGGILKKKFWLWLYLNIAPNPIFFKPYSLFHQDAPCNPSSIPFLLGLASIHMFLMHFVTVQRMPEKDRYCCVLFDEMLIRQNVWFNQKFDCIERFEDLGSQGRTCNIAIHVLIFMVCGLHRKWKQPVSYYLSRGYTKAEMLEQFLKEVLDACQNVGLHVVATVCDMGTNNVKAMRLLGSTTSEPFFQFQNQEIATIYDPPHLLKCTPNLFLKYDVQFKSEHVDSQHPVIAKWEHIEELYKHDRDFMIGMLYKLTPTWPLLLSVPRK
jgi:hypothetical protein